ncbi:Lyr family protein [Lasiodiplodia theobromae]|uniref:Lyr family protein n=1 Tax=Lasiodiplodia theobromae TaxID=45133 RepID=UPI0015C38C35|nr:Lyr family protein [Lasiodiplodia theobromae]KAF4540095.1 Lyr family protein [Lasiodiplodia theobromae]
MPRDSQLLPDHSQILLRAARAGRLYKLPTPPDEEEKEKGEEEEETTTTKEPQTGYTTKKWSQVPRHMEEPEPEYLAKRRKGLPSAFSRQSTNGHSVPSGPMRETKVKKTDADGSVHVYKVLVPEGQTVEGEVAEEDAEMKEAAPEEALPGTVVEGVGIVNAEGVVVANQPTPPRRRPPPPRRKPKKGPGRGRKKVMFTPGEGGNGATTGADGSAQGGDPNIKSEGTPAPGDTPMAEGGDDDEEGSEGSEGDEEDDENREGSPTPGVNTPLPKTEESATPAPAPGPTESASTSVPPEGAQAPIATTEALPTAPEQVIPKKRRASSDDRDASSSPDLPLAGAPGSNSRQNSEQRKTKTPTPPAKKSATPPQTTETKIEPEQVDQPISAPEAPSEQKPEQPQEPPKEKTPEQKGEAPAEPPTQPAEPRPAEQQPEPEAMDIDAMVALPETGPLGAADGQAVESELDIFGSLEQQLENEGNN